MKWQQVMALAIGLVSVGFIVMSAIHQLKQNDRDGFTGAAVLAVLFLILTILAVFQ